MAEVYAVVGSHKCRYYKIDTRKDGVSDSACCRIELSKMGRGTCPSQAIAVLSQVDNI